MMFETQNKLLPKKISCRNLFYHFLPQKALLFYKQAETTLAHQSEHKSLMIKYPSFLQLFTFSLFNAVLRAEMVRIWHTGDSGKFSVSAAHKLDG
jgi:hypothetical protein